TGRTAATFFATRSSGNDSGRFRTLPFCSRDFYAEAWLSDD
ncbi:hypothetical protein THAOC_09144, partial [Thalassiosira oceanica]